MPQHLPTDDKVVGVFCWETIPLIETGADR